MTAEFKTLISWARAALNLQEVSEVPPLEDALTRMKPVIKRIQALADKLDAEAARIEKLDPRIDPKLEAELSAVRQTVIAAKIPAFNMQGPWGLQNEPGPEAAYYSGKNKSAVKEAETAIKETAASLHGHARELRTMASSAEDAVKKYYAQYGPGTPHAEKNKPRK